MTLRLSAYVASGQEARDKGDMIGGHLLPPEFFNGPRSGGWLRVSGKPVDVLPDGSQIFDADVIVPVG